MDIPCANMLAEYLSDTEYLMAHPDNGRSSEYYQGLIDGLADTLSIVYGQDPDIILEYLAYPK